MKISDGDSDDVVATPRFTAAAPPPPAIADPIPIVPGAAVAVKDNPAGDGDTKSKPGPEGGWQAATAVPALQGSSADHAWTSLLQERIGEREGDGEGERYGGHR